MSHVIWAVWVNEVEISSFFIFISYFLILLPAMETKRGIKWMRRSPLKEYNQELISYRKQNVVFSVVSCHNALWL
jgi:hypothetical protein